MANNTELRQRNTELRILNEIAEMLNSSLDLAQALHGTLAKVAELLALETGWVLLFDPDSAEPYLAAAQNLPPGLAEDPVRMTGLCYCLRTFREGDLADAANVSVMTCSRLDELVAGTAGLQYHSSIPLVAHGRKLGVLNVASRDWRRLSAEDLRLLHTIGDLLSIAIERARLFAESARLGALEERNRLAREIHDTVAQGLTAITLKLETADALLEGTDGAEMGHSAVVAALQLARTNLEEVRRSVMDLRAASLAGRTLAEALVDLTRQLNSDDLRVYFLLRDEDRPLSPRIEAGLYRIAQEALTNVQRHAQASRVLVELTLRPDRVRLTVEDNGRGFDPLQIAEGRFGLIGLNERVKILHGRVAIASSVGEGTEVMVEIPLKEE